MPTPSFPHLTLEHIDPSKHELVCGLNCLDNEVIADSHYNYGKSDLFLPYRVADYPAPVNPGDLGEFLIRGGWVVTEFMGEWYKFEAQKFSARRLNKPQHEDWTDIWLSRIKDLEDKLDVSIVLCSWDGTVTKATLCRRRCSHGLSKPYEVWKTLKSDSFCCQKHCNQAHAKLGGQAKRERANTNKPVIAG
jgi:hypothetical protein